MLTDRDLWIEAENLAREIRADAKEYDEDEYELTHQTVDSHEWVIYTHRAKALAAVDYDGAAEMFEDLGGAAGATDFGTLATRYAYCVLFCAVSEALARLADEEDDDEDE